MNAHLAGLKLIIRMKRPTLARTYKKEGTTKFSCLQKEQFGKQKQLNWPEGRKLVFIYLLKMFCTYVNSSQLFEDFPTRGHQLSLDQHYF